MRTIFLGPTFFEAGQTKTLSYAPTEIEQPFRCGHFTVPHKLEGLSGFVLENLTVKGERGMGSNPVPLQAFMDGPGAVNITLNLEEVHVGEEIAFTIRNTSKESRMFVAALGEMPPQIPTAMMMGAMAAAAGMPNSMAAPTITPPNTIIEQRDHVVPFGPIVIPHDYPTDGYQWMKEPWAQVLMPWRDSDGNLIWTLKAPRLDCFDEFVPRRIVVPSAIASDFMIYDVEIAGRGQRYYQQLRAHAEKPTDPPPGPLAPFSATLIDEHAEARDANMKRGPAIEFLFKAKLGHQFAIQLKNISKEPKSFSAAIVGLAAIYADNLIDS